MKKINSLMSMLVISVLILGVTIVALSYYDNQENSAGNRNQQSANKEHLEPSMGLAPRTNEKPTSPAMPYPKASSIGLTSSNKTMYGFNAYDPSGITKVGPVYCALDDPGNLTLLAEQTSAFFISGGTLTNDDRWLGSEFTTGALWEIDPYTGSMTRIGGGNASLNGLAFDPVTEKLYGASGAALFEVDINNGEQTYIGHFGDPTMMIGIAFDPSGTLYGWDIGKDRLWTIDTSTGVATEVGSLMAGSQNLNLNYAQDGAFDLDTDILYLTAFTITPDYGGFLYECDEDTAQCTLIGAFEGEAEIAGSIITNRFKALETSIDIDPDTLNLKSNGRWITVRIGLSTGYDVNDINITTVELEGIPADWGNIENDLLMVKFNRSAVIEYIRDVLGITNGEVQLWVTGSLYDGTVLKGSNTIRVIHG